MKAIFSIYQQDLKRNTTNPAAMVIIIGLIILPSLYAWFNIKASWDPYGNTQGIAIAVVNKDKGTTLRGKEINIGEKIVASLKTNKKMGWTFVNESQAVEGVKHGDYYASVVIPEDFSRKIGTVVTGEPTKPEIIYTVNEKINAVAPKITSKGASGIVEEVGSNFVKTANGVIFKLFNELGIELEKELPTIEKVEELIFRLEKSFPNIKNAVNTALTDVNKSQNIVNQAQRNLPIVEEMAKDGQRLTEKINDVLNKSNKVMNKMSPNIKQDLESLRETAAAVQNASLNPASAEQALQRIQMAMPLDDSLIHLFERLNHLSNRNLFSAEIGNLKQVKSDLQQERPKEAERILSNMLNRYDQDIKPKVEEVIGKAKRDAENARSILNNGNNNIPDVQKVLNDAAKGLSIGKEDLLSIKQSLPAAEAKINDLADKIRTFESKTNIQDVINLLKNNYKEESEFFARPVKLKEHKLYPIPNYGSAMSPFYTTLALWVGALLLVSLMTVEVPDGDFRYKSYHIYFGRFLTFLTIALLQSAVVTLGDIFILKVYAADKLWFVLFSLLISAVFMLIVYTFVSVFGNIGKALAIVLLVLQISGSGGTFPIQVLPPFFQAISPFLPFTYAISLMREAVGGILRDIVQRDLIAMLVFAVIALVIGLALKKGINRLSSHFVKRVREGRLIH
ncbi:putative membrane protein [Scopulibacillus darangshiensis]|uniref:Putative membrane protein n=1 Tax=Scopulibacillus darangshiensis TaxID=442528 RepID=A0A4R2P9Y4_9BACL|nr:YhgE/Pip domain-containing protein [Scopulibacillus darangshiensis]TCP31752.1 putative membrane protein [Scopulibacillus darangshiensis]